MKRVTTLLLSLVLLMTASFGTMAPSAAAQDPAPVEVTVTIDGVSGSVEPGGVVFVDVYGHITCSVPLEGQITYRAMQDLPSGGQISDEGTQPAECGERFSFTPASPRGRFGGGEIYLAVHFEGCVPGGVVCGEGDASGTFTVSGVGPPLALILKTFRLTVYGTATPDDADISFIVTLEAHEAGLGFDGERQLCGPSGTRCEGGGTVHTAVSSLPVGERFTIYWSLGDAFISETETLYADVTNDAWYDLDTDTGGLGQRPSAPPGEPDSEPTPGDIQDDQQDDGTGAGDDQQGTGTDTGKTPDNQHGGGDTATKTFELTLNGMVPAGDYFTVTYSVSDPATGDPLLDDIEQFCGPDEGTVPCDGDGTVYTTAIEVPRGAKLSFAFMRSSAGGGQDQEFHSGTETVVADRTNAAWFTYGGGDDDQQGSDDKDTGTGAGDDRQDDTRDDQSGEMPEELPETGAGGLAPGTTIPVGPVAAGLPILAGVRYAVLRRR